MTDSPPLSRKFLAADVAPSGSEVEIVATEAERAAIAALNDVVSVERFVARLRVTAWDGDGLRVTGPVDADVTRLCVVSLEPFPSTVSDTADIRFSPHAVEIDEEEEASGADLSSEDPPDRLVGGVIDLGVVASEFFTLALDPHPRKPGVRFETPADPAGTGSPFEALRKLSERE